MKTYAWILGMVLALILSGCGSPRIGPAAQRREITQTVQIEVEPENAKVVILGPTYRKLDEGVAVAGKIKFEIIGSEYDMVNAQLEIEATADGYYKERRAIKLHEPGPFKVILTKDAFTKAADDLKTAKARREEYTANHTELSPAMQTAIGEGKLLAGMNWEQAQASLGHLGFEMKSETAEGEVSLWNGRDQYYFYSLYFARGWLVRWTTQPLYR